MFSQPPLRRLRSIFPNYYDKYGTSRQISVFYVGEEGIYPILQGEVRLKPDKVARLRGEMTWAAVANSVGAGGVKSIPIFRIAAKAASLRPEGPYGEFFLVCKL